MTVQDVTDALSQRGFAFADKIPNVDAVFVLFQSPDLVKVQTLVRVLDRVATWLAAVVAVGEVFAAPQGRRLRALSPVGLAVAIAMALLAL